MCVSLSLFLSPSLILAASFFLRNSHWLLGVGRPHPCIFNVYTNIFHPSQVSMNWSEDIVDFHSVLLGDTHLGRVCS